MPMLYSSSTVNNVVQWIIVAQNFLADSAGRFVLPGIGVKSGLTCVPFADLQTRIAAARAMGTPGETFFSYGEINDCGYWDDFANGPYSSPAVIPHPDWKP